MRNVPAIRDAETASRVRRSHVLYRFIMKRSRMELDRALVAQPVKQGRVSFAVFRERGTCGPVRAS